MAALRILLDRRASRFHRSTRPLSTAALCRASSAGQGRNPPAPGQFPETLKREATQHADADQRKYPLATLMKACQEYPLRFVGNT